MRRFLAFSVFILFLFGCSTPFLEYPYVIVPELPINFEIEFATRYENHVKCSILGKLTEKDRADIEKGILLIKKLVPDIPIPKNYSFNNVYWSDFKKYVMTTRKKVPIFY